MWRSAALAILLTGLVLNALPATEVTSKLASDVPPELASPYQRYELNLRVFSPAPRRPAGVLLRVRINGGRPLRMLLDSGAELIVIGTKPARSVGLSGSSEMDLVGLGNKPASVARAETIAIGPVVFRNCRVALMNGTVVEGVDGVIPLSLFSQFLLHLDLPAGKLGLIPYPSEESPARATPGVRRHNLLLVDTVLNGGSHGYVLVDTGAYCSAISREVARPLTGSQIAPEMQLTAATGMASGKYIASNVHFTMGQQDLVADKVVALDLSNLTRHYGVEVIGVLGFPVLNRYFLIIDYRNGRLKIEPPQSASPLELHLDRDPRPPSPSAFR